MHAHRGPATVTRLARALASITLGALACGPTPDTFLDLTLRDASSDAPLSARIEVLAEDGTPYVATDAIGLTLECETAPPPDWAAGWVETDRLENPHTGTTQFYADASAHLRLPPGRYRVRVERGPEYRRAEHQVEVLGGGTTTLAVPLERWIDPSQDGWYGADDHLHITRRTGDDDRRIARWMAAEGLAIANLLQMGTAQQLSVTPQHDFGDAGAFRDRDVLVLAGQEHPRTHFLGHTITLGADRSLDRREDYIVYHRLWKQVRTHGGAAGFAHFGAGPAQDGLAIDAPSGLLSFIEVLQFEYAGYDVWYELLNLGIRIAPSAGTDFPCGPWSIPGRERVYVHVGGALDRESFVEAVRGGRTFVTNGPILGLEVGGVGIGETLALEAPGEARVVATVRFDPARDSVSEVALVRNGELIPLRMHEDAPGSLRAEVTLPIDHESWVALRLRGDKQGEAPLGPMDFPDWVLAVGARIAAGANLDAREAHVAEHRTRATLAHTAPVWVEVGGALRRGEAPDAAALAKEWVTRLDALEARLADDRIAEIPIWDWLTRYSDGVSEAHLRAHRDALVSAIARSRAWYAERAALARAPASR